MQTEREALRKPLQSHMLNVINNDMKQLVVAIILTLSCSIKAFSCECSGPYEFKTKEDLEEYQFIALVSIDSIYFSNISKTFEHDIFYQADLSILEIFKGDQEYFE